MASLNGKTIKPLRFGLKVPEHLQTAWKKPPMPKKLGCIYFIRAGETDVVKIGYCRLGQHNERRLGLQVANSETLKVLAIIEDKSMADEAALHKKFKIRGEWFRFSNEILNYMKENARRV
jgi:hypothetical protein